MDDVINQAMLNYHHVVLTKIVGLAVELTDEHGKYVCVTCGQAHVLREGVPHPSNCPVGDLQQLLDGYLG